MEKVYEELEEAKAEIERLKKLEEENKQLSLSLDEANEKDKEHQLRINALTEETESLKALVSNLQKKCSEAKSPKETLRSGDGLLQELEDRQKKAEDELKWKIEQFKHLEEAHDKLRDQFNSSRGEWESEKSSMLDEISKLQESLETECSTAQAGEDGVANLRHSLRVKEMECKDLEYKAKKLEAENRDLLASIKELQEAHIRKSVTPQSSWVKLRSKLKNLEQTHKACSANLKAKEVEWTSRAQKMTHELKRCSSSLMIRDQVIEELKKEIEDCHSSLTQLKLQNEELSLMLQLMRSGNSEANSDEQNKDNSSLVKAKYYLEEELTEKTNEVRDLEFELLEWKTVADCLKDQIEVSLAMRRELEASLLDQTELEEMLKQDVEDKNQRISNLQQQIMLIDQEIMIREENSTETTSVRWQADDGEEEIEYDDDEDDDEHEQELLAKELEIAILTHIMEERKQDARVEHHEVKVTIEHNLREGSGLTVKVGRTDDGEGDETSSAKENVNRQNSSIKTGESCIDDDRSPFRVLN